MDRVVWNKIYLSIYVSNIIHYDLTYENNCIRKFPRVQ